MHQLQRPGFDTVEFEGAADEAVLNIVRKKYLIIWLFNNSAGVSRKENVFVSILLAAKLKRKENPSLKFETTTQHRLLPDPSWSRWSLPFKQEG